MSVASFSSSAWSATARPRPALAAGWALPTRALPTLSAYRALPSRAALSRRSPAAGAAWRRGLATAADPMSVALTSKAAAQILKVAADNQTLRLAVDAGGCSGFSYAFELDTEPEEGDRVFEAAGAKLLVDKISLPFLLGSTIDFKSTMISESFQVHLPRSLLLRSSLLLLLPAAAHAVLLLMLLLLLLLVRLLLLSPLLPQRSRRTRKQRRHAGAEPGTSGSLLLIPEVNPAADGRR